MNNQSPQALASKWASRTSGATEAYKAGVQAVDVAPGQLAAQQKEKYVRRVQEKADKWAANVAAVSLEAWKRAALEKGARRISEGVELAKAKYAQFIGEFMNFQRSTVAPAMANMPKSTLEDGIARAVFVIRANADFGRNRRGMSSPFGIPFVPFTN